jgi:hypothetical protein
MAYKIQREYIVLGKKVHVFFPSKVPDYPIRLFNKEEVWYPKSEKPVHEKPEGFERTEVLEGTVYHYTCDRREQLWQKLHRYTSLEAEYSRCLGVRPSHVKLIFYPIAAFLKWYLYKGGWKDGSVGLLLGIYAYKYSLLKYAKLLRK